MINNDRLLFEVADGIQKANVLTQAAWEKQAITHPNALKLIAELRRASAAAQELERRAAGCEPPKEG